MADVKRGARRERALATRLAILRAAHEVFCASGYHGATMAAIADRAGVAVQTVYFVFHTKPALLAAAVDHAVMGEDDPTPPDETAWWREALTSRDPGRALAAFVDGFTEIQSRVGELDLVVRAGADTDPELRVVWDESEAMRGAGYLVLAQSLAERGFLRAGVSVDEATDVLMTLAGPMTYLTFTRDRSWSDEHFARFTADALVRVLVEPRRRRRARSGAAHR